MNVLSLFDGMSCGRIALERAKIKVDNYYASEIDVNSQIISSKNYPEIIRLGDVSKHKNWELPKIDLLLGGSPCQGFSNQGKGLNFEDPRSKLFFEYVKILKKLRKENPNIKFLLENVKMKKEWQDVISKYLGVEPIEINSNLVSAQNRKRLYWTNIDGFEKPKDKGLLLKDILDYNMDENDWFISDRMNEAIKTTTYASYARVLDINEKCTTLMAGIGSELKKTIEIKKDYVKIKGVRKNSLIGRKRYLSPLETERLQTVPDNYTYGVANTQRYRMLGNGWTVDVIVGILEKMNKT